MKLKIGDIVLVEWVDSVEITGWQMMNEIAKPQPYETESIGRLVKRGKEGIIVAGSSAKDQYCGIMIIPRRSITSIKKLRTKGGTK